MTWAACNFSCRRWSDNLLDFLKFSNTIPCFPASVLSRKGAGAVPFQKHPTLSTINLHSFSFSVAYFCQYVFSTGSGGTQAPSGSPQQWCRKQESPMGRRERKLQQEHIQRRNHPGPSGPAKDGQCFFLGRCDIRADSSFDSPRYRFCFGPGL